MQIFASLSVLMALLFGPPLAEALNSNKAWQPPRHVQLFNVPAPTTRKLFFLFMANDHLPHADIWDAFFAQAKQGVDYEALLHCQNDQACQQIAPAFGTSFRPDVIPTVPSEYCSNLIDPMLALLKHALSKNSSESPQFDQFVFISDTTVPAKPFRNVSTLLRGMSHKPTTRFCVEPWNIGKHAHNGTAILVKNSQWLTLGRRDAMELLKKEYMYQKTIDVRDIGGQGCSDEYWFFAVLFGVLKPHYGETFEHALKRVDGLNVACDTYVDWEHQFIDANMPVPMSIPYGPPARPVVSELRLHSDPSVPREPIMAQIRRGKFGPAEVREFSKETLQAFKASPWSFLRKVATNVRIKSSEPIGKLDAFKSYVFEA